MVQHVLIIVFKWFTLMGLCGDELSFQKNSILWHSHYSTLCNIKLQTFNSNYDWNKQDYVCPNTMASMNVS